MRHFRTLFAETLRVLRLELSLFYGRRRLGLAIVGVMLVPSLYALMYLSSVWDPYGNAGNLPVAIVNGDHDVDYRGRRVAMGEEIVKKLEAERVFHFQRFGDGEAARAAVRRGEVAFALLIPEDFSARAVRGAHDAPGELKVYVAEGNSYMAASTARRFAAELSHKSSEALNAQRWSVVVGRLSASGEQVERLHDAVGKLRDGAHKLDDGLARATGGAAQLDDGLSRARGGAKQLADGTERLSGGTRALTSGVEQLGAGIRLMNARLPAETDLAALARGATAVARGSHDLHDGMLQIESGADRLHDGAGKLREGVAKIPFFGGRAADGAGQIESGLGKLEGGVQRAADGSSKLADGAARVSDGVGRLTNGMSQLGAGIRVMAERIPEDARLEQLAEGSEKVAAGTRTLTAGIDRLDDGATKLNGGLVKLHDGSSRLAAGLDQLHDALPSHIDVLDGDAEGLAASVRPVTEVVSPVPNNGTGFAPYFMPLALWVGAVMTAFVLHLHKLPEPARSAPRYAQLFGKLGVPAAIVVGQATLIALMGRFVLGIAVPRPGLFYLTLVTSSLVFLSIVTLLVRVFGDAGKVIAVLLLILQISAAGGPFPVELSAPVFQAIHPFLPFTHAMKALRAALFGAYDGAFQPFYMRLLASGLGITAVTAWIGAYRFVPEESYAPALDM